MLNSGSIFTVLKKLLKGAGKARNKQRGFITRAGPFAERRDRATETYLITGATGYIGSMLVKHIIASDPGAKVTALVRSRQKAERLFPEGVEILAADLTDRPAVKRLNPVCDYIIHCASITKSDEMISHPVEVAESIIGTAWNVLELARRRRVRGMVYLSSMEVYGQVAGADGHRTAEDGLGSVELLNCRSCYPLGKRMAENLCYSYYKEYGVPVKIARLAQVFGHGVPPGDTRVFAQFARAVKDGTDIVLHTRGESMGNYCAVEDAVSGILTVLMHGKDGEAYNVVNEANTMAICEMAELAAEKVAGGKIQVRYDIPEGNVYGYAADTGLRLSGQKLMALGWKPGKGLEEMYRDVLEGWAGA